MKRLKNYQFLLLGAAVGAMALTSCSDDDDIAPGEKSDAAYFGQAVGNFSADEWYPGGQLGTTENTSSSAFSDQDPAVDNDKDLFNLFFQGEQIFERQYTENTTKAFSGLGPASVRRSCLDCHPEYGHGKWKASYETQYGNGNGYLLVVYHPSANDPNAQYNSDGQSNDGGFIAEVTGMPQTQAVEPFKAPIDESQINLQWKTLTKADFDAYPDHNDDWKTDANGNFCFPDGTPFAYQLRYPDIRIPASAFNTDPVPTNYAVRIESTIGVGGTGLIDAIPEDSIKAQYSSEYNYFKSAHPDNVGEYINATFFDGANFGSLYNLGNGQFLNGQKTVSCQDHMIKRYSYALTRATLQDANGANAVWNIPNVSRSDRPYLYTTEAWALKMSEDPEVIAKIKADPTSPYYADGTDAGIANAVKTLLSPKTNQFNNSIHNFTPEMSDQQFYAFMVWHRGLSIPRARNLNDPDVQRGKTLFYQMGCTSCHRPKWTTGDDNYWLPQAMVDKGYTKLPRYQHQTIYPYSDYVQHKLYMKNDIHGSWCRTTPLWGRGLELLNTGAQDRLHDCRAQNEEEAILWHMYSKKSHAYFDAKQFYNLPKADRDAVVKFIQSI